MGFPPFLSTIVGGAKLCGVIALLIPGQALLKEWAYAGCTFNLVGALLSRIFAGDPVGTLVAPLVLVGLASVSYLLRPSDRRLPAVPSFAD